MVLIAVVFLDRGLRVRLFTPEAKDFYNFAPGDIGRPIFNLRLLIRGFSLEDDAKKVRERWSPLSDKCAASTAKHSIA